MARYGVLMVLLAAVVGVVTAQQPLSGCGICDRSKCPAVPSCPGAEALDACGCCAVCVRSVGQRCDGPKATSVRYGPCGEWLTCRLRTDIGLTYESTCECVREGQVCGSDNVTYATPCHLLQEATARPDLTEYRQGPCLAKPVVKTPPKASIRPLGGILVLDCEATGFPVPAITWELYRPDGLTIKLPNDDSGIAVQIRGGPEQYMVTGWVQIMKVTKENVGTYVCIATNNQGQEKATAVVNYIG